jgi:hypothetical protein
VRLVGKAAVIITCSREVERLAHSFLKQLQITCALINDVQPIERYDTWYVYSLTETLSNMQLSFASIRHLGKI